MPEGGLILVLQRLQQIAVAGSLAASSLREAAEERKAYNEELRETARIENSSSAVSKAKGGGASTLGAREGAGSGGAGVPKAVTAAGTIAALKSLRGRWK